VTPVVPEPLLERLYRKADAARWSVRRESFAQALEASAARGLGADEAGRAFERYLEGLHLRDLALACACAGGHDGAWEQFVRELRPVLYRAADALDPAGGARDLADSLYADLYGLDERGRQRASLFRYYHGRSSLATWLRAVLAQRHVDRLRQIRRADPLPETEPEARAPGVPEPDRGRWVTLVSSALEHGLRALDARDRLRLAAYYVDGLTLAEIGRIVGEHEATVSRHLSRVRRELRTAIETDLVNAGLTPDAVAQCLSSVAADPATIDLGRALTQEEAATPVQRTGTS
jgi:RNA polymerase sigma-70 factor (ECF subfamily)